MEDMATNYAKITTFTLVDIDTDKCQISLLLVEGFGFNLFKQRHIITSLRQIDCIIPPHCANTMHEHYINIY